MPAVDDRLGFLFVDLFVARDQLGLAAWLGIFDVLGRAPADDPVVERFDDFLADRDVADGDAVASCRNLPRG